MPPDVVAEHATPQDVQARSRPSLRVAVRWFTGARLAWTGAYAVAAVVLYLCYLWLSRTQPIPSDGASNALEAWDMLHGNLLLHGWTLTDVSFYTTELPEYMLVESVRGLGPDVVHVAAAVTYTLLVLLASLLAKGRATGREAVVRVLLASGIMIAPQLDYVHVFLQVPDHVGTGVPLLAIFIVLDRAPRYWYVPPVIGLLLTWVVIADRIAITLAVVPLLVVCGVRAGQRLARERKDAWFELGLALASLASVGVGQFVIKAIAHSGGFQLTPLVFGFARGSVMPTNSWLTFEGVLGVYGADFLGMPFGVLAAIALLHLAGLSLALWALCRAFRRYLRWDDLIIQVLAVAIVFNIAAYLFSNLPYTLWDTRQISAILPFGAVLAARLLAGDMLRARLVPAMAAVLACYLAALGYGLTQPKVPAHDQALAGWLVAHHLTTGISAYPEGNITTLDSNGKVQLRVVSWQGNTAVPRAFQSNASWYDAHRYYASFVVNTAIDGPAANIPDSYIIGTFGQPAQTYHYGPYTIMVWDKNLFAQLGGPPSQGIGSFAAAALAYAR